MTIAKPQSSNSGGPNDKSKKSPELAVLLEEWHRLIPDYELVELPNELAAGGIVGLDSLPLRWKVWRGNRARSRGFRPLILARRWSRFLLCACSSA